MNSMRWKLVLVLGVLVFCIWVLLPSYRYYTMPREQRDGLSPDQRSRFIQKAIKLGLDLQGGMHVVLEVDDSKLDENAKKDAVDRAIEIIRNRVDQFGVSEPVIQKQGEKRIIVQLPGLQDQERARRLIGQTAQLEFRLVRQQDEVARVLRALDRALIGVTVSGTKVDSTGADTLATREAAGSAEEADAGASRADSASTVERETTGLDSLLGTLGQTETAVPLSREISPDRPFTSYLVSYVNGGVVVDERDVPAVTALLATPQARRAIPRNSEFLWQARPRPLQGGGMGRVLFLCERRATLTGSHLTDAVTRPDPDNPAQLNVGFTLDRKGGLIFARFTGENIGRRIAIVLDGKVRSAPVVQSKIPGGEGRITGLDSDAEANDLAIVLRAGALPAPVRIIEERTVGPTLGRDSIVAGTRAAIGGFLVVMLFMVVYYRASGLLACGALVFNLFIVLAVLARLHAALTLPGIAGLILTIGMAVDANVLIFERIREELAKAKTVRAAIEAGYDRAFNAILDANVTTLITAFVLWQFGTGPIKGFATTLSIGIIASMFTALLCTRLVYDAITARRQLRSLSI